MIKPRSFDDISIVDFDEMIFADNFNIIDCLASIAYLKDAKKAADFLKHLKKSKPLPLSKKELEEILGKIKVIETHADLYTEKLVYEKQSVLESCSLVILFIS